MKINELENNAGEDALKNFHLGLEKNAEAMIDDVYRCLITAANVVVASKDAGAPGLGLARKHHWRRGQSAGRP